MPQSNYQEPIEKEDVDLQKKFKGENKEPKTEVREKKEEEQVSVPEAPEAEKLPSAEREAVPETPADVETLADKQEEKVAEKIETARKTIGVQKVPSAASVATDAQSISQITEYEKKVEKLVELALQKGPEHAIQVAQHMDKGRSSGEKDNYTLDEIHDRLLEDDLRKQLIQKGLLKEL